MTFRREIGASDPRPVWLPIWRGGWKALRIAGRPEDGHAVAGNAQSFAAALEAGKTAITEDAQFVCTSPHIDVVIDATGKPAVGAEIGLTAMEHGKHLVMMNVEAYALTLGGEGAYYHGREGLMFRIPAFGIAVKCTCGCGDAFNAGFAVGLVKGFGPEDTVRFAQATSALNATGVGSQAGVESFEHTLNFMKTAKTK